MFFSSHILINMVIGVFWLRSIWWGIRIEFMLLVWGFALPATTDSIEKRCWYSCWYSWSHQGILPNNASFKLLFNIQYNTSLNLLLNLWNHHAGSHRKGKSWFQGTKIPSTWWSWWNVEDGLCWRRWAYFRYAGKTWDGNFLYFKHIFPSYFGFFTGMLPVVKVVLAYSLVII